MPPRGGGPSLSFQDWRGPDAPFQTRGRPKDRRFGTGSESHPYHPGTTGRGAACPEVNQTSSSKRLGSSMQSLIRTSAVTASLPSTTRWS